MSQETQNNNSIMIIIAVLLILAMIGFGSFYLLKGSPEKEAEVTAQTEVEPGDQAQQEAAAEEVAPTPEMDELTVLTLEKGNPDLSEENIAFLENTVKPLLEDNQEAIIQILSYAAENPEEPNEARRISLSRGMAARSVLKNAGVPEDRIKLMVRGTNTDKEPFDRIELKLIEKQPDPPVEKGLSEESKD